MDSRIALSICIATHNRGTFIGATLDSIISQANEKIEIVIVDGAENFTVTLEGAILKCSAISVVDTEFPFRERMESAFR